ncbi:MAG: hypothetical protein Q8N74_03865 [Sulfuricella sp.]|nr:hypothetical protein [Sulfuricella sp.]
MTQQSSAPLLAANKALDEITAIAATHLPPDKFTHDRLERTIKSSIPIDAAFGYATLGALEAVSGNEELMDSYHQNSIQLCNDVLMHRNYACSLLHVSRVREAADQARIAASLGDGDLEAIQTAINYTAQSGGITMADSLVETYRKLAPTDAGAYADLIKAATMQKNTGIADEEIMQLVQIACDFLRSKQVHFVDQELIADEEDEGFLSLCINLNLTNEEIWNFNRQLFEIMLDQVPNQSPHLSVRFGRNRAT